ncbi:bifunctional 3-(3-hydroxy-phenyl)propionate/3-hydroxycinnamic acid hydroxylase MhpA [Pigmentiphaga litoralis]|uniref:bifunctional 3-(3-hydroxy-phenyl)propionate/3-hydroxycinnamic acid hydroxylase MhpA n=1 Tax=Pigmentiphaga litoralis TaxID=516702 RepID=UPI0015C7274F|nr:bifunctional 3-(3-hydroxy-phenyl)propionate/3-hydroxycinnamic acid hydroxylase [Pigmentiphaga litoralis]
MSEVAYDVAVVGLGPSGAMLANLLGAAGLSVLVLERLPDVVPTPRAIHFDGEVMRAFQSIGLGDAVAAIARPGTEGMHFVNATGRTLLVRRGSALAGPHGCANNYYFHQPELERALRDGLQRYPNVQVRLGFDLESIDVTGDGATLLGREVGMEAAGGEPPPPGPTETFRARYVVGADGARSLVRKTMGSTREDLGLHQPWLVFDVMLNRGVDLDLPRHTVQHCDPARPMTYCNVTDRRRRWEIMLMPGDDPARLVEPDTLWQLVSRWVRPDQATLERAAIYTFHSVITQGWRKGPLLLAGDSAHQTPPFLGQGMCAGIRDAVNLAWKLVAVLRGDANDDLLDTYEAERAPHVRAFIDLAVQLGDLIQTTDPEAARARDARFADGSPALFDSPTPRLPPGALTQDHPAAGRPLIQPRQDDGTGFDAVLGHDYALLVDTQRWPAKADPGAPSAPAVPPPSPRLRILTDLPPALRAWLQDHSAAAVLVRPDRYIAAVAHDPGNLPALLTHFPFSPHRPS